MLIGPSGETIAGEARWRVARRIGLTRIPTIEFARLGDRARGLCTRRFGRNSSKNSQTGASKAVASVAFIGVLPEQDVAWDSDLGFDNRVVEIRWLAAASDAPTGDPGAVILGTVLRPCCHLHVNDVVRDV